MSGEAFGLYKAKVANNRDPQQGARVTLLIPQLFGESQSEWADPSSPTPFVPSSGDTVWVQFSGGDLSKPVYSAVGFSDLAGAIGGGGDLEPPKPPTGLGLTTAATVSIQGTVAATVTALWTPPTQNQDGTPLTDFDHYEVQASYDNATWSGAVLTVDDTLVYQNVRPGVNYWVRVVSVDTSGNRSTSVTATIVTGSSSTPPPQPSNPSIAGVLGSIRIAWNGLDHSGNPMPALFDHVVVQRSVNGLFTDTVISGTMRGADVVYDAGLDYNTTYTYRLLPVSTVGVTGTPSATGTGSPVQAVTQDILDGAVIAIKTALVGLDADTVLAAGSLHALTGIIADIDASTIITGVLDASLVSVINLVADNITAGNLDANLVTIRNLTADMITSGTIGTNLLLAGSISTPVTAGIGRVSMSPTGIVLYDMSGNIDVNLPTDPALSASFAGNILANTLTVTGGASVRGVNNELAVGGELILRSGLTTNGASAQPVVDFDTSPIFSTGPVLGSGLMWDSDKFYVLGPVRAGIQHRTGFQLYEYEWNGSQNNIPLFDTTGVTTLGSLQDAHSKSDTTYGGGVTKLGSYWYILTRDLNSGAIIVRKVAVSTGVELLRWTLSATTPAYIPAIGNDGTNILIAQCTSATGATVITVRTESTGAVTSTLTSTHLLSQDLASVIKGSFDFGSTHYVVSTRTPEGSGGFVVTDGEDFVVYTASGSTLTHDTDHDWHSAVDFAGWGVTWDATNSCFVSIEGGNRLYRYTSTFISTATGSLWWAAFAWRQTTHSYLSLPSAANSFTMIKRARLTVNTPSIPTTGNASVDPDAVSIYLSAHATAPSNSQLFLQTNPSAGVISYLVPSPPALSGTNPATSSNFPASTAALLVSDTKRSNNNPLVSIGGDGVIKASDITLGDPGTNQVEFVRYKNLDSFDSKVWERRDYLNNGGVGLVTELFRDAVSRAKFGFGIDASLRFVPDSVAYTVPLEIDAGGSTSSLHATGGIPYAQSLQTASVNGSSVAAGAFASTTVTWPAGRFTVAPNVEVSMNTAPGGSNNVVVRAGSITTSGCTLYAYNAGASAATWTGLSITAHATQMTPTTADG